MLQTRYSDPKSSNRKDAVQYSTVQTPAARPKSAVSTLPAPHTSTVCTQPASNDLQRQRVRDAGSLCSRPHFPSSTRGHRPEIRRPVFKRPVPRVGLWRIVRRPCCEAGVSGDLALFVRFVFAGTLGTLSTRAHMGSSWYVCLERSCFEFV
jgi:hypothetical protein